MTFTFGAPVLYRALDENQDLTSVLPVRLVGDLAPEVSLWLPIGTPSMKPVLRGHTPGTPRRWSPGCWALEPATWTWAELLIIIPLERRHATWLRWSANREFLGWYVNMQSLVRRTHLGFDYWDHQLDILVAPDRTWRFKDEDELDVAVQMGRMSAAEAEDVRSEAYRVVAEIEGGESPFTPERIAGRPNADWPRPALPAEWADLSMYRR